jgi:uncharacterized protein involved in outer membrane biogenesis
VKKLLIGVIAVGVLLVAAILVAPSFIDWNAHKQEITALVRDATGRELAIRGNIDVTILPSPALRVEDVRLSSIPGAAAAEMVRLPEARISAAFAPLLEGRLALVVTLVRPTINLEKLQDGRVNWDFGPAAGPGAAHSAAQGKPSSGIPFDVKLDSFRIENGTLGYQDAVGGTAERIESLNSEISFDSLRGPFRIDGKASFRGIPMALRAAAGTIKPDAPLPVNVEVSTEDGASTLRLNGTVSGLDSEPAVNAELDAKSESVAAFLRTVLHVTVPEVFAQPLIVHGKVAGTAKRMSVDAVEIEFGEARATADLEAELGERPSVNVNVRSGNLNLDAFLDGPKADGSRPAKADPKAATGTAVELPAIAANAEAFVLPADFDASVTIESEIIQYNGALVRDLSVKAALKEGKIVVEDVSAVMPGSTIFGMKGAVAAVNGKPELDLQVSSRSDNLREMLEWQGVDVTSVPPDRLRRFSLSAAVTGAPKNLTAKGIDVQLDASKLSGGLALVLRDRPAFGLRFVIDRLNLDGYLASRDAPIQSARASVSSVNPAAKPENPKTDPLGGVAKLLSELERFDANIDGRVNNLIVARTPATDLHVDLTVLNGELEIKQAEIGDLAGLKAAVKGKLDRSKEQPSIDADYTVEITDTARFARFIDNPSLMKQRSGGRFASSGKIAGNLDRLAVNSRLEALGVQADVDGAVTALLSAPAFKVATTIKAPELVQVVRLAAAEYSPAAGKLGPVDASFQLEGTAQQIKADSITGHVGPVTLHGSGTLVLGGQRPKLSAAIQTSEVSLDLFLPLEERRRSEVPEEFRIIPVVASQAPAAANVRWSSEPIDTALLDALDAEVAVDMAVLAKSHFRFKDTKIRLRLDAGKLALDPFSANFSTGTVTLTGALAAQQQKLAGTLNAALNNVDAGDLIEALRNYQVRLGPVRFGAKVSGPVNVTAALATLGGSQRELVNGLNGTARTTGQLRTDLSSETRQAGAVAGIAGALLGSKVKEIRGITDVVQGTDLLISAFEGSSTLNGDFTVDRGVTTTRNLVLVGRGGRALTTATASLPVWTLESVTDVTLGQDTEPYLTAQVTGALDDPYVRKVSGTLLRGTPVSTQNAPPGAQPRQGSAPRIVSPQDSRQPAPSNQKQKPEDILKGLLQGLSR